MIGEIIVLLICTFLAVKTAEIVMLNCKADLHYMIVGLMSKSLNIVVHIAKFGLKTTLVFKPSYKHHPRISCKSHCQTCMYTQRSLGVCWVVYLSKKVEWK